MITMMIGIIHANDTYAIDFENEIINPKDRVVYTGQVIDPLHKLLKRMMDIWLGEKIVYVMVLIM